MTPATTRREDEVTAVAPPPPPGRAGPWSIEDLAGDDPRLRRHEIPPDDARRWRTLLHAGVVVFAETPRCLREAGPILERAIVRPRSSAGDRGRTRPPRVLLGGLGLGTVARHAAAAGATVTAIEIDEDVLELAGPAARAAGVELVHGDVRSINPAAIDLKHGPFAAVWLDIWPDDDARRVDDRIAMWKRWRPHARWCGLWPMRPLVGRGGGEAPAWQ